MLRRLERSRAPGGAPSEPKFRLGQSIWVNGRPAMFCYEVLPGNVVVRYQGETTTRVIPRYKIAVAPPEQPQ